MEVVSFRIPKKLKRDMRRAGINWSEEIRKFIEATVREYVGRKALEEIDEGFLREVDNRISSLMTNRARDSLRGIVEMRGDGPIIVTKKRLTHYEAIGLILYSMKDHRHRAGR